ncbi:MAG: bifunctional UDP-N-acetylglucosamine diphosphorylase/glucosamine-1-phosphate N-acetyltransferase GlmU [Anaerolineaceae bacterium]
MKTIAIILAAGQGTRMVSNLPKVLHLLAGRPMIHYAIEIASQTGMEKPLVVTGHGAEKVQQAVGSRADFAVQQPQLGTGHAVQTCQNLLEGKTDQVVVITADMPLLRTESIRDLIEMQASNEGPITILTIIAGDPRGFGRIVRGPDGGVEAIVEEAACTPEQLKIRELNISAYCFKADWLWQALKQIKVSAKGEYYLTDVVAIARQAGLKVQASVLQDENEAIGINTRVHLAEAEKLMRRRINETHMLAGVSMVDPDSTYIDSGVVIGRDTVILPNTSLSGTTVIGENCSIGPNCVISNTRIGSDCKIIASFMEDAVVEDHVSMGPFAHLRKGAHLMNGVHMGNFGEVKDSTLAAGVKVGHFSYIGNATIGENVNIGAGTITCNFDGKKKHPTVIGANAFIGSDTMLVAPLKIGEGARTGAGSVVTHDVPDNGLVAGVPARPLHKK